ncbi:putative RNA-directed DNA polymerase, eukaryota, reverse transcriptase zinc-binding domain protein, partial [Tanacetum coccineum]
VPTPSEMTQDDMPEPHPRGPETPDASAPTAHHGSNVGSGIIHVLTPTSASNTLLIPPEAPRISGPCAVVLHTLKSGHDIGTSVSTQRKRTRQDSQVRSSSCEAGPSKRVRHPTATDRRVSVGRANRQPPTVSCAFDDSNTDVVHPVHHSVVMIIGVLCATFCLSFLVLACKKFCHSDATPQAPHAIIRSRSRFSGINRKAIESLPFFTFASLKGSKEGLECVVCLSKFEDSEVLRLLPKCKHAFHMKCIDEWLERHSTCPLCRYKFDESDVMNFTCTNSLRYPQNEDFTNLEIFIKREHDGSSRSSRFSIGTSITKCGRSTPKEEVLIQYGDQRLLDKFKHRIIVSDIVCKSRWSDVNSSDLMFLNSKMLNEVSSMRFSPSSSRRSFEIDVEKLMKFKEDKVGKTLNNGESSVSIPNFPRSVTNEESEGIEKRSMSEITNVSRFRERRSSYWLNSGKEEALQRVWLPMAKRTIQWYDAASKEQSAFIAGRQILDGPLILSESWFRFQMEILDSCLPSFARASILINGSPTSEFSIKRVSSGLIRGVKMGSSDITLSHLFYADDVIITTDWNSGDLDNIIRVLHVFYLASGLKINIHKSNIFGIGVPNGDVVDMARRTGCASGTFPFTYLGLPIGSNMNLVSSWQFLFDRFHTKLSSWKANLLSIGGRLTLIKAVLGSLGIYYLSIYKAPETVLKYLERYRAKFFWGGSQDSRNLAWIKWTNALSSFDKGGLNIGSLKAFNLDLLQKWRWKLFSSPNSLWVNVIKSMHGYECGFDNQGYIWIGDSPLYIRYNRLFRLDPDKDCLIIDRIANGQWNWNWFREDIGVRNKAYLRDLLLEISDPS